MEQQRVLKPDRSTAPEEGTREPGKLLLVHGASSAGKSTLCRALQAALPEPFWHYSLDHFRDAGVLPRARFQSGEFRWAEHRTAFFNGFHRSLVAFLETGNNLLVEHIVETSVCKQQLQALLSPFSVLYIALRCPLDELERRERERGDRPVGDAKRDFEQVYAFGPYDLELDSTVPLEENVARVLVAWARRPSTSQFFLPPDV